MRSVRFCTAMQGGKMHNKRQDSCFHASGRNRTIPLGRRTTSAGNASRCRSIPHATGSRDSHKQPACFHNLLPEHKKESHTSCHAVQESNQLWCDGAEPLRLITSQSASFLSYHSFTSEWHWRLLPFILYLTFFYHIASGRSFIQHSEK